MDVYRGQTGTTQLVMHDAQGRETLVYDEAHGIVYSKIAGPADTSQIADEDAEPKDATITVLREHADGEADDVFQVEFDGRVGSEERLVALVSDPIRVVPRPPGEAVGGTFTVTFREQT